MASVLSAIIVSILIIASVLVYKKCECKKKMKKNVSSLITYTSSTGIVNGDRTFNQVIEALPYPKDTWEIAKDRIEISEYFSIS